MNDDHDRRHDAAYVDELVSRALGNTPSSALGPAATAAPTAALRARRQVPRRLKLLVFRLAHRVAVPIVRHEIQAQLVPFMHSQRALAAGIASLEVVVEDLRDTLERIAGAEEEVAPRPGSLADESSSPAPAGP